LINQRRLNIDTLNWLATTTMLALASSDFMPSPPLFF